jgi:hypothetical protein
MEIPLFCQIVCIGIAGLAIFVFVLRKLAFWRHQTQDPLRYLRGKSPEEIGQILRTPVYDMPPKAHCRSKRKTKQSHREP